MASIPGPNTGVDGAGTHGRAGLRQDRAYHPAHEAKRLIRQPMEVQ